jgi:plasmid maintenance system antidote protein VapI
MKAAKKHEQAKSQWPEVIRALVDAGWTQTSIADACGCAQNTISALLRGVTTEPVHSLGESILGLRRRAPPKKGAK